MNYQLDELKNKHPIIFNNNKTLIADAAYDSSMLRSKVKELKLGQLISPINKRNSKIVVNRNSLIDKIKTRYKIENIIAKYKKFKKIQLRYDKYLATFKNSIFIVTIFFIIESTKIKISKLNN